MDFIDCAAINVKVLPFGEGISRYSKAKMTVNPDYVGTYRQYHSQLLDPEDENRTDFDFVFSLRTGGPILSSKRNVPTCITGRWAKFGEKITQNRNILSGLLNQNHPRPL
jgi:hypothetical protein